MWIERTWPFENPSCLARCNDASPGIVGLRPDCSPTGWERPILGGMGFRSDREKPLWRLTFWYQAGVVGMIRRRSS